MFSLIPAALLFKFIGPAPKRFDTNAPNLNRRLYSISSISYPKFIVLAQFFRLYNAKTFLSRHTQAYISVPPTELIIYRMFIPLQLSLCKCPRRSGGKNERFTEHYLITSLKRIAANAPRSDEPYHFSDVTGNLN